MADMSWLQCSDMLHEREENRGREERVEGRRNGHHGEEEAVTKMRGGTVGSRYPRYGDAGEGREREAAHHDDPVGLQALAASLK